MANHPLLKFKFQVLLAGIIIDLVYNARISALISGSDKNLNKTIIPDKSLSDNQGIKLKEIRKLARLAGHENPKNITEISPNICYKDDCLKAAKEFFIAMDFSSDPCTDWKKFACEWRTLSSKTGLDQQTALQLKVEGQIKDILQKGSEKEVLNTAQSYYSACLKWFGSDLNVKNVTSYLEGIGNWPLLTGKDGNTELLKILKEILRIAPENVEPFILSLEPAEVDGKNVLQIGSGSTSLGVSSDDIQQLLQILRGKKDSSDDKAEIREMWKAMSILAGAAFDAATSENLKVTSLKNLQNSLESDNPNGFNVEALIKLIFEGTDLKVKSEMEVITDYQALLKYLKALQSLNKKVVINIAFLQLAMILVGDLTRILDKDFGLENYKRTKFFQPTKQCLEETSHVFPYAISEEYLEKYFAGTETIDSARKLFGNLKNGAIGTISDITWLERKSKDFIQDKILKLEASIGFPNWIWDGAAFNKYHENMGLNEKDPNYIEYRVKALAWLNGKYFKMKLENEKLNSWNYNEKSGLVADTSVEYFESVNQIRVPAGILQQPMFSKDFPGYMNFGGLGSIIAREMAKIINFKGDWLDDKSYKGFAEWSTRLQNDWDDVDIDLETKVESVLAYHIMMKGFSEYLTSLKKNGGEVELPGLNMDVEKLLHVKYTNVLCESSQVKRLRLIERGEQKPNSDSIYGITQTNKFAKTFGCEMERFNPAFDLL